MDDKEEEQRRGRREGGESIPEERKSEDEEEEERGASAEEGREGPYQMYILFSPLLSKDHTGSAVLLRVVTPQQRPTRDSDQPPL